MIYDTKTGTITPDPIGDTGNTNTNYMIRLATMPDYFDRADIPAPNSEEDFKQPYAKHYV